LAIAFNLPNEWRSRGGGKWGHAPRGAVLGSASTHLIQLFKIAVLSRKLDKNMPKNAYFLEKTL